MNRKLFILALVLVGGCRLFGDTKVPPRETAEQRDDSPAVAPKVISVVTVRSAPQAEEAESQLTRDLKAAAESE